MSEFPLELTDAKTNQSREERLETDYSGGDLELLKMACKASGRSLGFWIDLTNGFDERSLVLLASRAYMMIPEISASCDSLRRDQNEIASMFLKIGHRDRKAFLRAVRDLVALRNGQLN